LSNFLSLTCNRVSNASIWFNFFIHNFVSEHFETLEEIDAEYKELALESGIEKWGRVPALVCEPLSFHIWQMM
jgi:protoheme ferro-lyase